jgi:starvation-inducible outer membrane lipoprotein
MRGNAMMTKPILLALMTLGLAACVQQPQAPRKMRD